MSIIESMAVARHYPNIHLLYIYNIVRYGILFIFPVLLYLRYKKIIDFFALKCLTMTLILAHIIIGCLYNGWSWIYLFYILMIYISLEAFEAEMLQGEQNQQNNCQGLHGEHKKENRKLSRTAKVSFIIFIIASVIKVILSCLSYWWNKIQKCMI